MMQEKNSIVKLRIGSKKAIDTEIQEIYWFLVDFRVRFSGICGSGYVINVK